jgi:protein-S-isoprenylcysteine O-methyltransferase Ste14
MERGFSLAALGAMVAGFVALYFAGALFSPSPAVIAAQLAAAALWLWARFSFGRRSFHPGAAPTPGGIVKRGPYRYIRHPIYTAASAIAWAGAFADGTALAISLAALVTGAAVARMLCEERLLARAYAEYRDYARTTKRMIPYLF